MLNKPEPQAEKRETVVIKKYANRRLYNTETSSYVTLEDLATMVRGDRDFVVYDAKSGDDLTHGVLTQIIVEQESRGNGQSSMLPIPFLRQLIRFYDDSMSKMVPGYLQYSLESLAKEQTKFRTQFAGAFGNPTAAFDVYQDQVRKNMELFEQALTMWVASPGSQLQVDLKKGPAPGPAAGQPGYVQPLPQVRTVTVSTPPVVEKRDSPRDEIGELKAQLAAMQQRIERIAQTRD